jgi:hypothetical protein
LILKRPAEDVNLITIASTDFLDCCGSHRKRGLSADADWPTRSFVSIFYDRRRSDGFDFDDYTHVRSVGVVFGLFDGQRSIRRRVFSRVMAAALTML